MSNKFKTAIKYRTPLFKIIKLLLAFWDILKDRKITKKERTEIIERILDIIISFKK